MSTAPDEEPLLSPKKIRARLAILATASILGMLLRRFYIELMLRGSVDWLYDNPLVPNLLIGFLLSDFYAHLSWALYVAPPALLAMAIVLPKWSDNARIMLLIMGVSTLGLAIMIVNRFHPAVLEYSQFPGAAFLVTVFICVLMRRAGYVIRFVPPAERSPTPGPLHFDMKQLLIVVAGIAIYFGIIRWFKTMDPDSLLASKLRPSIIPFTLELMRILPAAILPVCAVLATTHVFPRCCLAAVCVVLASLGTVFYFEPGRLWLYPLASLLLAYLCLLAAYVVRSCGIRLVRDVGESLANELPAGGTPAEGTSDRETEPA